MVLLITIVIITLIVMISLSKGYCWVCHEYIWSWDCFTPELGTINHHKKCHDEATKRQNAYLDKWYGEEEELFDINKDIDKDTNNV